LLEPFDDQQLTGQVSPLQSPLVWDLAHIGYFEELWLLRNGNDGPVAGWAISMTRSRTSAPSAGRFRSFHRPRPAPT
jgi:hypothetical protein